MPDIASLRAEIKAWEQNYRNAHGRDPSIQDIKEQPAIVEKYKLYKKLTKAAASEYKPPRSPPVQAVKDSQTAPIISKPRSVKAAAPLPVNPFSPVKNRGKAKDDSPSQVQLKRKTNVFSTPVKNKSKSRPSRDVTPEMFPLIQPPKASTSEDASLPVHQNTAISRARKRLRGEPVSPSPDKQKRQRLASGILSLTSGRPSYQGLGEEANGSSSDDDVDTNSSYVDDSPVKVATGGKSFQLLFEDAVPRANAPTKTKPTRSLSRTTSKNIFGEGGLKSSVSLNASDEDAEWGLTADVFSAAPRGKDQQYNDREARSSAFLPGKERYANDDVFGGVDPANPSSSLQRAIHANKLTPTGLLPAKGAKRMLFEVEPASEDRAEEAPRHVQLPLLPPSPPPVDSYDSSKYKGKGKETTARKKARIIQEDQEPEDETSDKIVVKIVNRRRADEALDNDDFDHDPILTYGTLYRDGLDGAADTRDGKFEVDLPDKFLSFLAISPSKSRDVQEERVVRGLLSGARVAHYDASRGGEVWDAGEYSDGGHLDTEAEEDWEGEPVPWEVGEL